MSAEAPVAPARSKLKLINNTTFQHATQNIPTSTIDTKCLSLASSDEIPINYQVSQSTSSYNISGITNVQNAQQYQLNKSKSCNKINTRISSLTSSGKTYGNENIKSFQNNFSSSSILTKKYEHNPRQYSEIPSLNNIENSECVRNEIILKENREYFDELSKSLSTNPNFSSATLPARFNRDRPEQNISKEDVGLCNSKKINANNSSHIRRPVSLDFSQTQTSPNFPIDDFQKKSTDFRRNNFGDRSVSSTSCQTDYTYGLYNPTEQAASQLASPTGGILSALTPTYAPVFFSFQPPHATTTATLTPVFLALPPANTPCTPLVYNLTPEGHPFVTQNNTQGIIPRSNASSISDTSSILSSSSADSHYQTQRQVLQQEPTNLTRHVTFL